MPVGGHKMPTQTALDIAVHEAKKWLAGLDERPVSATVGLETLRSRLNLKLRDEGLRADEVIEHLVKDTEGGILGSASGRFFA